MVLVIAVVTVLIRAPNFADPNYHIDESFYLLVGKAMHSGALPYVDLWDRKPLGLFLIYWLIAGLGGSGIPQYHAVAGLFAFATAVTIAMIAARLYRPVVATLSAIVYLATLETLAGGGGQAPVFYNLFIALAVLMAMKAWQAERIEEFRGPAFGAMALGGLALFVKQTALVECLWLGIAVLAAGWRIDPSPHRLVRRAAAFVLLGAFPSALAFLVYGLLGYADHYWFANVTSIFMKAGPTGEARLGMALHLLSRMLPQLVMAVAGCIILARSRSSYGWLVMGWVASAIGGFLTVPNFFDHYALPLAAPFATASGVLFARHRTGLIYAAIAILWPLYWAGWPAFERTRESRTNFSEAVAIIQRHRAGGDLYVFDGPPYLYVATGSVPPTSRAFPEHINNATELGATGIDTMAELGRILDAKPGVIVKAAHPVVRSPNRLAQEELERELHPHYRRVAIVPLPEFALTRPMEIWVRGD